MSPVRPVDRETLLHRGLIGLVILNMLATCYELATERHWATPLQLIPWAALGALAVATALLAARGRAAVRAVRVLAVLVLLASLYGIVQHVVANYAAGVLDANYGQGWDGLPVSVRLWYAVTKTVGPTPPLAPGVLAQAALLVLLATFVRSSGHRGVVGPSSAPARRR